MKESEKVNATRRRFFTEFDLHNNDAIIRPTPSGLTDDELDEHFKTVAALWNLTAKTSEVTLPQSDYHKAMEDFIESLRLADELADESDSAPITPPLLPRPPFNAEYLLHIFLKKNERDGVIGDLVESYGRLVCRFGKRYADIWFYKQVFGSLSPLLRQQILRIGALLWLGRILRRLIS
jgi:hypothetical protein